MIDEKLVSSNLKPDQEDEDWEGYYEFVKSMQDGTIKKSRSAKRKAETPRLKSTKKLSLDRLDVLDKQWEEQSGVSRGTSRSSLRLQGKGRKNLAESSDEESGNDSDMTVTETPRHQRTIDFESSPIRA